MDAEKNSMANNSNGSESMNEENNSMTNSSDGPESLNEETNSNLNSSEGLESATEDSYSTKNTLTMIKESMKRDSSVTLIEKSSLPQLEASITQNNFFLYKSLRMCQKHLLPDYFKDSVSEDYSEYQVWTAFQVFCLTFIGTLSLQTMMTEFEFKAARGLLAAATIVWFLRDIGNVVGRLVQEKLILWKKFENNLKECTVLLAAGNCLIVGLEYYFYTYIGPNCIMLLLTILLRAILYGVDGYIIKTVTRHQAQFDNLENVTLCNDRQTSSVRFLAFLCSGVYVYMNTIYNGRFLPKLWLILTDVYIYSSYRGAKCLILKTLNMQRFSILCRMYLIHGRYCSPKQVNRHEGVFFNKRIDIKSLCGFNIKLGTSFTPSDVPPIHELKLLNIAFENHPYILFININTRIIYICMKRKAIHVDAVQALYQAMWLALAASIINGNQVRNHLPWTLYPLQRLRIQIMQSSSKTNHMKTCIKCKKYNQLSAEAMVVAEIMTRKHFSDFLIGISEVGWDIKRHQLPMECYIIHWHNKPSRDDSSAQHLLEYLSETNKPEHVLEAQDAFDTMVNEETQEIIHKVEASK